MKRHEIRSRHNEDAATLREYSRVNASAKKLFLIGAALAVGAFVFAASSLVARAATVSAATKISVVPLPVRVAIQGRPFTLTPQTRIVIGAPESAGAAHLLARQLRIATGFSFPLQTSKSAKSRRDAIFLTTRGADSALGKEGYQLDVTPQTITLRAPASAGLFYATQTLRQLLPPQIEAREKARGVSWKVPGVCIWDKPRFSYRGFMLDSSRHLQSESFVKRTLDLMAYHKLNVFQWHLTDDQGWRIESKKYPKLNEIGSWREENGKRYGGFFTQDQIRDIVAYAAQRGITIIPEIEMPGHAATMIRAYPELSCAAGGNVLCPGKESTFRFLEGVLSEVMELFPSKTIHIGGDEVDKTSWKNCASCQAIIAREGLKDEDGLQSWFTRRIAAFLRGKGRRMQGWNEIMRGGQLPHDAIVQQWDQPQSAAEAARDGYDVVVSQTTWTYFDYSYETTSLHKVYDGEPIPAGLTPAQARHILGAQAQLWTEVRPTDASADLFIWPRLIALAEVVWSPKAARDWDDFSRRLQTAHFERLALRGLGTASIDPKLVRRHLANPMEELVGKRVAAWQPQQIGATTQPVDYDVSDFFKSPGIYRVKLRYRNGAHGVNVESAALLEDGKEIARDAHSGFAGGYSRGNLYELNVARIKAGTRYVLRLELRGEGGTDSHGEIWLQTPGEDGAMN